MSKQLYEEALADVKKLKEIAEDNAKKALIEAVSPRIKDLIESELLREVEEASAESEDDLLLDDGLGMTSSTGIPVSSQEKSGIQVAVSLPDEEGKVTLDLDALAASPNEFEVDDESMGALGSVVDGMRTTAATHMEARLFQLGESVENLLESDSKVKKSISFRQKVEGMVSEIEKTYEYLQGSAGNFRNKEIYEGKLENLYKKLNKLVEQGNMKNLKSLTEAEIALKLTNVPDELEDELDNLGVELVAGGEESDEEAPEGEEGSEEELDLDLGEEGGEEEAAGEEAGKKEESLRLSDNVIVEIDEGMLRREIARMRSLRESADDVQTWGHGPGEVSDEFEDEDMGDPFVDIDLSEADLPEEDEDQVDEMDQVDEADSDQVDEMDEMAYEMDGQMKSQAVDRPGSRGQVAGPGAGSSKRGRSPGTDVAEVQKKDDEKHEVACEADGEEDDADKKEVQHESIRARLTREVRLQTEAKKKAAAAKKKQAEAKKKAHEKQQEAQQKMKQKMLQEAQKAKQEAQKQAKHAKKMAEAYAYYANIFNESVRRTAKLQSVLAERRNEDRRNGASTRSTEETSTLRKKLAETNLFNTKLLYSNKLLQNESLTKRQKAEIIERLDEAASEREVKLVYESLVKALGGNSRPMTEGAQRQVLGSSSQATRSASSVISESYEADRWAKLAGIK